MSPALAPPVKCQLTSSGDAGGNVPPSQPILAAHAPQTPPLLVESLDEVRYQLEDPTRRCDSAILEPERLTLEREHEALASGTQQEVEVAHSIINDPFSTDGTSAGSCAQIAATSASARRATETAGSLEQHPPGAAASTEPVPEAASARVMIAPKGAIENNNAGAKGRVR